jgi:hypothetical protein
MLLILGRGYDPETRLFPTIIGAFTFFCLLFALVMDFSPRFRKVLDLDIFALEKGTGQGAFEEESERDSFKSLAFIIGWLVGFFWFMYFLGFLIATPVFFLVFMRGYRREPWLSSILLTVIFTPSIHLVFRYVFHLELFKGVLWR